MSAGVPRARIAVIVGAYRRSDFLERAVDSVLRQTAPRTEFEVVVVKDFADAALDARLTARGVRVVPDSEPVIGAWLLHAVAATTAPLVAFLDDDDEFVPERLAAVGTIFAERPALGYYRNRVTVIDADGRPVPPSRWRTLETDAAFDRSGPVSIAADATAGALPWLTRDTFVSFNSSTVVVRRELLEGPSGAAFATTQLPDLALLVAAIAGPYELYLDDRRLTRFRFHGENVTRETAWLARAARSQAALADFAASAGRPEYAAWLRGMALHYERVFESTRLLAEVRAGAPRRSVAATLSAYLRWLGRHPNLSKRNPEIWSPALYAALEVVRPGLGRRIARARDPARR